MYFSSTTSLASPITSPQRHHHHQNITSDSPLYFYDSHLTQNSSGQQSRNLYLSRSDSRRPFIQSTQYSSPVQQGDNDYNNRLYDNVPQSRIPPLARNRSFSGSSASLYEADDLLRPIAEVKPFPVYSTTEQAVASAEQRLYDAVTTLNRRRAAGAYSSYSTPMNVRRNSVSSLQPTMFSNGVGSSPGIIRPKPICGYSPAVSRSASVQHGNQTPILAHSNHYYPSSGVTVGRRSYFPVYRTDTDFRTPVTDAFTRRTTSKPSVHEIPVRCDQTPIARSSYPTPEAVYATTTRVRSRQSPGYPNDGYSSPGFTVLKRPSHYAVSNGLASMQFNSSDHSANKAVDGLKWTQPANNQLRFDDSPRPPPSRMEGQKQCLSCTLKGVTCPGVRHSDLRYEHPRMHSQQLPRRHVSRSSPPTTRGLPIPKKQFPTELNLHGKPREPPSYDAFYQSNAYSSSSSAYSSGSSPPEPVDSSVVSADSPLSVSFPAMSTSAFVPPVPKVNKVPPRPGHKPRPMPQATIAAVSPNNVSTVSVSEDPASALPPRASSAIPFESASAKATPKKYSTLRPGRPTIPPPPPPANTKPKLPAVPDHATADRRPDVARPATMTSSTTRPLLISRPSLTSQCSFDGADSRKFFGSHPVKSHDSNRVKRESLMEQASSMLQTDSPVMPRSSLNKNPKPSTSSVNPPQSHEVSNINPPRKSDFSTPLTIDTTSYQCTSSEDQMDSPSSILKTTNSDPMSDVSNSSRCKFVAFPDELHSSLDSGCPAPLASYYSASDVSIGSSRRTVAKQSEKVSKRPCKEAPQRSKEGSVTPPTKPLPELPKEKPNRPVSRELSPVTLLHDGPPLWSLPVGERDPFSGNSGAHFPYIPKEIPTPPGGIIIQSVNRVKYEDIRRRAAMYPKPVPTPPPFIIGADDSTLNRRLSVTKPELPPKPENVLADDSNSLPSRRSSVVKPEPPPKPVFVRAGDSKNTSIRRSSILRPNPEPKPVHVQADEKNSPIRRPSILRPNSEPVPKPVDVQADDFSNVSECLKTTLKPDRPLKPASESKRNSAYEPIAVLAYNIQNVSECRRSALLPPHLTKPASEPESEPAPITVIAHDDQTELDCQQSTSDSEYADAYQIRSYDSRGVSECPIDLPHHKNFRFMKMTASQMLLKLKSGKIHKKSIFSSNKSYSLGFADTLETDKTHLAGSSAAPRPHRGYDTGITASGAVTHVSSTAVRRVDDKKEKKRKKEKKKLRKEDIGIPTNFQHKAHIGWDQDGGFNQQVFGDEPMDDSVRDLLRAAGHNPDNLKPDEIKFVYNFIENYNKSGKNAEPLVTTHSVPLPPTNNSRTLAVNGRLTGQRPLPATPSLHSSNPLPAIPRHEHVPARPPPPPPPAFQQPYHAQPPPPPPPPVTPSNRTASLSSSHAPAPVSSSAPPPPPPPPVSKALKPSGNAAPPPPPPPPPPNFLNGGGASTNGASEHKTEAAPKPPAPAANGARSNLLAEIQAGKNLKRVGPPPEKSIGKVVGGSTRDNMMEEIRQGANLKHVDQNAVAERRKSVSVQNLDGIAGALARALESRRNRMNQSDSEDEEANDSEWEDD